jgi:hypothetical protein
MTHIRVHMHDTGEARLAGVNAIAAIKPSDYSAARSIITILGVDSPWWVRETVDEIEALLLAAK